MGNRDVGRSILKKTGTKASAFLYRLACFHLALPRRPAPLRLTNQEPKIARMSAPRLVIAGASHRTELLGGKIFDSIPRPFGRYPKPTSLPYLRRQAPRAKGLSEDAKNVQTPGAFAGLLVVKTVSNHLDIRTLA